MFLRSNSGLDSRFKKKIEFKDYNGKELTEIFLNMVKKKGLSLSDEAAGKVGKYFERMYLSRTDTFWQRPRGAQRIRPLLRAALHQNGGSE